MGCRPLFLRLFQLCFAGNVPVHRALLVELHLRVHLADVVLGVGDGPLLLVEELPDAVGGHRGSVANLNGRNQILVQAGIDSDDAIVPGKVVAHIR